MVGWRALGSSSAPRTCWAAFQAGFPHQPSPLSKRGSLLPARSASGVPSYPAWSGPGRVASHLRSLVQAGLPVTSVCSRSRPHLRHRHCKPGSFALHPPSVPVTLSLSRPKASGLIYCLRGFLMPPDPLQPWFAGSFSCPLLTNGCKLKADGVQGFWISYL